MKINSLLVLFSFVLVSVLGTEVPDMTAGTNETVVLDSVPDADETTHASSTGNENASCDNTSKEHADETTQTSSTGNETVSSDRTSKDEPISEEQLESDEHSTTTESIEKEATDTSTNEMTRDSATDNAPESPDQEAKKGEPPIQTGPFIDLFGPTLLSLNMIDGSHAQILQNYTNEALRGKKVVGLYFSADWCNPCRQFTPDLVSFYKKMNARRGKEGQFEIVWISRCRDVDSFAQYFTHMDWLALPPEMAMGQHGQFLSQKYKVKGIPTLVLLDEVGSVITTDARNKIPQDKAGVGFPWRNPVATLYMTILPRSLRHMLKAQVALVKDKVLAKIKGVFGKKATA